MISPNSFINKIRLGIFLIIYITLSSDFTNCDKIFQLSPLHNNSRPVEPPVIQVAVSSRLMCAQICSRDLTCLNFFYKDYLCSTYTGSLHSKSYITDTGTKAYEKLFRTDCHDVMPRESGVYRIAPNDSGPSVSAYCESTGWLVIQRRTDGSEDFYRTWNEYRDGFGDMNNEFWFGNTNIYRITSQGAYELRIELEDFDGNSAYALYKNFAVAPEADYFRLSLGAYSGTAGDSLGNLIGQRFTAKDLDLDQLDDRNCAEWFSGAWWYLQCHRSNLNGLYLRGSTTTFANGVIWKAFRGYYYSLKTSVMKIRPMQL